MEARVIKFNQSRVPDYIQKFLDVHAVESANTSAAYEKDIKDFFSIVKGKSINQLNEDDLHIELVDFEDFKLKLNNEGLAHVTINRKVQTSKSLLQYLSARMKETNIDTSYFSQVTKLKKKSQPWHSLTVEEVFKMAELAEETEREKGKKKKLFILFALDTCIRQGAIRNLTWDNFIEMDNEVIVEGIDKGNKEFRKSISKDFYNELLSVKNGSNKVFDISVDAVTDMVKRLKKEMGIPDNRRIVFHSIRKAGITFAYRVTGDVLAAMKAGNHSSFDTTKNYIQEHDYGTVGAYSSLNGASLDIIDQVNHEELLNAIKDLPKDAQFILAKKLHEQKNSQI